jgi:hypothetical protein
MRLIVLGAALLLAGSPAIAAPSVPPPVVVVVPAPSQNVSAKKKSSDFDMGQMMAIFDRLFPAQPEPPAPRLALARTAVRGLLPDGTYARMMGGMMHGVVDRFMGLTQADLGVKGKNGKPADTTTMRQQFAKGDPYFDERMRITERVMSEEFGKIATLIEPRLRDGLAHSMARRFDEKQLADINAFLATDSGRAYGAQSMAMWIDPDVMRSMMTSFPEMMKAMPAAMQRLQAETAHLPKPKPKPKAKSQSGK